MAPSIPGRCRRGQLDLTRRVEWRAPQGADVEVDLCREAAISDRHVVRVLDPNPGQESRLQALPDSSTRGDRDADQRDEGDTPDHGREDGVIRMSATRGSLSRARIGSPPKNRRDRRGYGATEILSKNR